MANLENVSLLDRPRLVVTKVRMGYVGLHLTGITVTVQQVILSKDI
jgi:hypothetical protein